MHCRGSSARDWNHAWASLAGSTLGVAAGARSAPDGYSIVLAGSRSLVISPVVIKKLACDPMKDLTPIESIALH